MLQDDDDDDTTPRSRHVQHTSTNDHTPILPRIHSFCSIGSREDGADNAAAVEAPAAYEVATNAIDAAESAIAAVRQQQLRGEIRQRRRRRLSVDDAMLYRQTPVHITHNNKR